MLPPGGRHGDSSMVGPRLQLTLGSVMVAIALIGLALRVGPRPWMPLALGGFQTGVQLVTHRAMDARCRAEGHEPSDEDRLGAEALNRRIACAVSLPFLVGWGVALLFLER